MDSIEEALAGALKMTREALAKPKRRNPMPEQAHTPLPWRIIERMAGNRVVAFEIVGPTHCGRGGGPICTIPVGFTTQEGDAELIVNAPETRAKMEALLAACEDFIACYDVDWVIRPEKLNKPEASPITQMRAAIAKAKA